MDNIDVIPRDDLPKIVVALHILVPLALCLLHLTGEALRINVTKSQQSSRHRQVGITNATAAKNRAGQFVRGSGLPVEAQHSAGHNGNGR